MNINKFFRLGVFVFLNFSIFCSGSFAGVVHLKNGDRLTGKIVQMDGGKIVIDTEMAGKVEIAMNNVSTFGSDDELEVHLSDGTIVKQSIAEGGDGQIVLAGSDVMDSQSVGIDKVSAINPPKPAEPKWKGDISAGLAYTRGNTKNESYSYSFNLRKRREQDRITFDGDGAKKKEQTGGSEVTTEDWMKVGGKYDRFFSKKGYWFGEGRYEQDEIADLESRIIAGGGLGYQWVESDDLNFSTEFGAANVFEKYETADSTESNFSMRLGYSYDQKFNSIFSIIHDLTYFPSAEDVGDYYLTSTAELRAKINDHLFTNFKVFFDYDATPASGQSSTDTKYIFGLGVNF